MALAATARARSPAAILSLVFGWEQRPSGEVTPSVTIDPAANGGDRAEVAVKGVNGRMDIEIRCALQRGVSGFYTYAQFSHEANRQTPHFLWMGLEWRHHVAGGPG